MIVDIHTHLWHSPDQLGPEIAGQLRKRYAASWERLDAGPQAHAHAMEPVDVAVVLGFRSAYLNAHVPNDMISQYVAAAPDRLIGFAGIDPMIAGTVNELDELGQQKFAGVTLSPAAQDYHPCDTRAMQVYEKCEALGLPVLFHQGTHQTRAIKLSFAQPHLYDEIARSFPKLKLIIAHCGHPWVDEALMIVAKHDNVFTEISDLTTRPWQLYNMLLQAHQFDVTDRLLFGSGFPYCTPAQAIESIYSLNRFSHGTGLPTVPREKLRTIIERDTLVMLGIKRRVSATDTASSPDQTPGEVESPPRSEAGAEDSPDSDAPVAADPVAADQTHDPDEPEDPDTPATEPEHQASQETRR